jgi:serine-type D-Ala-D-Ala carboxypeptidase (penicillin-binding protein 5/6)
VTASASRNGIRMIAVVMGCEKGKVRFDEASRLLSMGFSQYKYVKLANKGTASKAPIPVKNGVKRETIPVTSEDLNAALKISEEKSIEKRTTLVKELTAPVTKGMECGSISFLVGDKEIGKISLYTSEDIEALGFWGRTFRWIGLN